MYVKNKVDFDPHLYSRTAGLLLIYSLLMNSDSVCRILRQSLGNHAGFSHYHRAWVPAEIFVGGGGGKPKKPRHMGAYTIECPTSTWCMGGGGVPPLIVNVNAIFNKYYKKVNRF